jgi:predicted metal-dependent hydrolase
MVQNAEWVYTHTIGSVRPLPPKRTYQDGEVFPFLDESLTIRIRRGYELSCSRQGDELLITVPADFTDYHTKMAVKQVVSAFFAEQLSLFALPYFTLYAALLNVPIPRIKTRDQKTKWGACTSKSIILNLRLCMAHEELLNMWFFMNWPIKFTLITPPVSGNTVESMMPDYKERREYLKKHGHEWIL